MVFNRKPEIKSFERPSLSSQPKDISPAKAEAAPPAQGPLYATSSAAHAAQTAGSEAALVESVIGSDLSIEGQAITIRCKGLLRVNGDIQADLHGRKLIVGDEATIVGAISAEAVDVYGKVQGSIEATSVMLRATADVEGDIASRTLSIEPGAAFDGRARKMSDVRAADQPRETFVTPLPVLHS